MNTAHITVSPVRSIARREVLPDAPVVHASIQRYNDEYDPHIHAHARAGISRWKEVWRCYGCGHANNSFPTPPPTGPTPPPPCELCGLCDDVHRRAPPPPRAAPPLHSQKPHKNRIPAQAHAVWSTQRNKLNGRADALRALLDDDTPSGPIEKPKPRNGSGDPTTTPAVSEEGAALMEGEGEGDGGGGGETPPAVLGVAEEDGSVVNDDGVSLVASHLSHSGAAPPASTPGSGVGEEGGGEGEGGSIAEEGRSVASGG